MATGSILQVTLPNPGPGGTPGPTWASEVNAAIQTICDHAVVSAAGGFVLTAGMLENADHELNGNRLTEALSIVFANRQDLATGSLDLRSLSVSGSDLYFTNGSGVRVRVTAGNALNIASAAGITGDYSGSTAQLGYDDPNKEFYAAQNVSGPSFSYAGLRTGDLKFFEKGNLGVGNSVTVKSPTALATSNVITLPVYALPAGGVLVSPTAGQLSGTISPTFVQMTGSDVLAVKLTGSDVRIVKLTGSDALFTKLTASAFTTLEADARHGLRQFLIPAGKFKSYEQMHGGTATGSQLNYPGIAGFTVETWSTISDVGNISHFTAPLDQVQVGETIGNVVASVTDTTQKQTLRVFKLTTTGAATKVAHVESAANTSTQHLTASIATTVLDGQAWTMVVSTSGSSQSFLGARVEVTR